MDGNTSIQKNPSSTYSRARSQSDDDAMTVSAISTDLSRYMAENVSSMVAHDSDVDSDTTTIAESIINSESAPKRKLIRSASFTVEIPTFENPAADEKTESWTDEFLNDQIKRLDDMRISLERYHRLQTDELIQKQRREMETVRMQKAFLESLLEKGDGAVLENASINASAVLEKGGTVSEKLSSNATILDKIAANAFLLDKIPSFTEKSPAITTKSISTRNLSKPKIDISSPNKSSSTSKRPTSEYFRSHSVNSRPLKTPVIVRSPPPSTIMSKSATSATLLESWGFDVTKSPQIIDSSKNGGIKEIPVVLKERLAGLVKGYLTRRWLETGKVKKVIDTIKDLQAQLISLEKEESLESVDEHFKRMLEYQLHTSKRQLTTILVTQTLTDRLDAIAQQRYDRQVEKRRTRNQAPDHPFGLLSSATLKSLTRKTFTSRIRLQATPSPSFGQANRNRRNVIRISPRPKTSLLASASPRKRKRFSPFTPTFSLARSPRRLSTNSGGSSQKGQRSNFDDSDDLSVRSSTTMNIRMTMNTVMRNQDQRWSGFCQVADDPKDSTKNRRPWR